MTVEITPTPHTTRKTFVQISARRTNGDKVYITRESRWEVEHIRKHLMTAARRSGLKMLEIAEMAQILALKQTLNELGEEPSSALIGLTHPPITPSGGGLEEPELWDRFCEDIETTNAILADDATGIDVIAWIAQWQASWCRYWSRHHSDPEQRALFAAILNYNLGVQQPEIRRQLRVQ
jgi:hypothetical protein